MSQGVSESVDLDRLDVEEVKRFLTRRWKTIFGTALVCAILAAIVCIAVTPVYTATSQVLLDPRKQHVFGQDTVQPDAALDSSIVDSQIPIILSTHLLAKVVAREHLVNDPEFDGPSRQSLLDRIFGFFRAKRMTQVEIPSFDGIDPKLQPVILHLFNRIDVTRVAKSYVISIAVSSRDPGKAMRLANGIAATYVADQVDVRGKSVQQAAAFFEERLGHLRDQVRQSEQAAADFRREHNLSTTQIDGKITIGGQQLQNLSEQLALASTDTAEKLARYNQATKVKLDGESLDSLPEIIRSPVISQLRQSQADLTRRAADLSATYGPAYPAIAQIRAQQAGLQKAIAAEMKRLVSTSKNDYDVAKAREASLRKNIEELTGVSGGDNDVGVKLRELERTNLANKALFENFLNRAKLTQEQSTFEEPDARLISPALEPTSPASPKTKLILPVAFIAGLILGLGLGAMQDYFRREPEVVAAKKANADAFILGRIPEVSERRGGRIDCTGYFEANPRSTFAQSIAALTERLIPGVGESRVATLASLGAGEGATSVALCVATAAGKSGKRILLIDADPVRRGLSVSVGAESRPGLSEVIASDLSANKAVVATPRFAVLPAGEARFSPSKERKALAAFLSEARQRFDLILIDAPVFDEGPDAAALIEVCDGFAIVASWETLLRETFIPAIDAAANQPKFLGIILNKTSAFVNEELALAS